MSIKFGTNYEFFQMLEVVRDWRKNDQWMLDDYVAKGDFFNVRDETEEPIKILSIDYSMLNIQHFYTLANFGEQANNCVVIFFKK
jgi:hypothetical protein